MNILTYTSKEIEKILVQKYGEENIEIIENRSVLTFMNDQNKISELNADNKLSTFNSINWKCDKFIFDMLSEVKKLVKSRELYFYEDDLSDELIKNISNKESLDPTTIHGSIYKQAIIVFINKIVRNFHTSDIILLDLTINNKYKVINNSFVELSKEEVEEVRRLNIHLKRLIRAFKVLLPQVNIIEINSYVYMSNFYDRDFVVDTEQRNKLISKIDEVVHIKKFKGEKIFPSIHPIKYYFEKAKYKNKDKLLVVFSAFSTDKAKYNYINTLKSYSCNKLFILDDFGTKGVYYLGLRGDFNIETSVISLITKIMADNNITFNNVISIGSSKGGTAAIYYGMKYNFGNIIAGAPQYKIGTYLSDLSINQYALDIFGGINDANRIKYNNLIRMISNNKTQIYVLTSDGDNQYKKVLKEFENVSQELGLKLTLDKCNIKNHGEISKEFPKYIYHKLDLILDKDYFNLTAYNKVTINAKNLVERYIKK